MVNLVGTGDLGTLLFCHLALPQHLVLPTALDFKHLLVALDNIAIVFIPYSVVTKIIHYGRDLILNVYNLPITIFLKKTRRDRLPHIH